MATLEPCPVCRHAKLPGSACLVCTTREASRALAQLQAAQWRVLEFSFPSDEARLAVRRSHALHVTQTDKFLALYEQTENAVAQAMRDGPAGLGDPWEVKAAG